MGFLTRYEGVERIDVTDLAADDTEYWVEVKLTLTGDEWDQADAAQTKINASFSQPTARRARRELARRRAGGDSELNTFVSIDSRAYNAAVLDFGIVGWNLTDAYDRPLMLPSRAEAEANPGAAEARKVVIARIPRPMRARIIEFLESSKSETEPGEGAEFRGDLPERGLDRDERGFADQGAVDAGGLVVAHWAEPRAGMEDLQSA